MQRWTKSVRPSRNITRSTCCPLLAVAICGATGGTFLVNSQLTSTEASATKIDTAFILETHSKNCAQLEIRLVMRISRLRESGDRHKPISTAIRDVRPDEEIPDLFRVSPLWKYKFMQQFYSRGNAWRDFIARTKRLDEFAFALGEITSFPYRFKCGIISEDERSEVFLHDQLRFQLDQSITRFQLSVDRQPDGIDNWVGKIVDQLDRRIRIGRAGLFWIGLVKPVSEINACLELVGYSVFEFVAELDRIKSAWPCGMAPRDPICQLQAARRWCIGLVKKSKVARATKRGQR